jgi:hypothetical protein
MVVLNRSCVPLVLVVTSGEAYRPPGLQRRGHRSAARLGGWCELAVFVGGDAVE